VHPRGDDRYQVVVHVDAPVLAGSEQAGQSALQDGARVPAGTSWRLACDASRVVVRHDRAGRLVEVDARRFPGCGLPFGHGRATTAALPWQREVAWGEGERSTRP
jgi:hypothetical protein